MNNTYFFVKKRDFPVLVFTGMLSPSSEAILSSLIRDPSRADTMMAEVRSQSADDLVDGVSSVQEARYDFQHYFGNRYARSTYLDALH